MNMQLAHERSDKGTREYRHTKQSLIKRRQKHFAL